jgi:catechol 2,3-dioxygenase-like lactoylglutathione lyase family enzyme
MTTAARELRFAFTFDEYDQALRLFRDVLGLEVIDTFDHQGGRGVIMRVPSATLELFDQEHAAMVDNIETGASPGWRSSNRNRRGRHHRSRRGSTGDRNDAGRRHR